MGGSKLMTPLLCKIFLFYFKSRTQNAWIPGSYLPNEIREHWACKEYLNFVSRSMLKKQTRIY